MTASSRILKSQPPVQAFLSEIRQLIRLATPILVAQVAQTAMTLVDTIMAGHFSAIDLAAVSVASSFWLPVILFVQGIVMALTPMVAQLNGARRSDAIPELTLQGLWLALLSSLPAMALLYYSPLLLGLLDVEPELALKTGGYLHAILWGIPAYSFYQVLRNYTEGLSVTTPTMYIGFLGLLLNIPLNYLFIYGKLGLPPMGGVGCGVASASVFWVMMLGMLIYVRLARPYAACRLFTQCYRPDWHQIVRIFRLGFPIAVGVFCEVTLFALIALLLAPLGAQLVASHQIALNFSSLIFMLPLSLGFATTIRVGHSIGEQQADRARLATLSSLSLGLFLALFTASFTLILRHWIATQYTNDPRVLSLAAQLLMLAAMYQFSDTVQAVSSGALRGYKDTRFILFITLLAYWGIGLTSGVLLGLTDWLMPPLGPTGFWIGLILGLTCAAGLYVMRLNTLFRRPLSEHCNG